MVTVLAWSAIDRGFEFWSGQTKPKITKLVFAWYTTLRNQGKDLFAQNQDSVSEWSTMSTLGLLFL
jgi:hypothetical protein